jgi:exopolysaccharide production protein ExoY
MSYTTEIVARNTDLQTRSVRPVGGAMKRAFDIAFTSVAILILLPLLAGCCLVVLATSPGPVLFRHRRIGHGGRSFNCLKFRTMEINADRRLHEYLASSEEARYEWEAFRKLQNDPRVTPFGAFMRRSSLDELPQLFNVLVGDMSIVGPRPIIMDEVEKYQEHFGVYVSGRPGLTGLWQVKGRNTTTYAQRVAYDVQYLRSWSLWRDIWIILTTISEVCTGRGAY